VNLLQVQACASCQRGKGNRLVHRCKLQPVVGGYVGQQGQSLYSSHSFTAGLTASFKLG
jgi:hypothetical protein